MTQARFTVYTMTGYDSGNRAPRGRGLLSAFDVLADAQAARDAHNAKHYAANSCAAFSHAEIIDRDDEFALVGFGYYGNGERITSVRSVLQVAAGDDVLFRGSRAECTAKRQTQCHSKSAA